MSSTLDIPPWIQWAQERAANPTNPTIGNLSEARGNLRTRETEREVAAKNLARFEAIEESAGEARERAAHLATEAETARERAAHLATEAETRWSASQTADLWRELEAARSVCDQAELRARSLRLAAETADVDLATAATRTQSARALDEAAARELLRAQDILRAWERSQQERNAAAAAREGERLREAEAVREDVGAWGKALRTEALPLLREALDHAIGFAETLQRLDAVLGARRTAAGALRARMQTAGMISHTSDPIPELDLNANAATIVCSVLPRLLHSRSVKVDQYHPVRRLVGFGAPELKAGTAASALAEAAINPT